MSASSALTHYLEAGGSPGLKRLQRRWIGGSVIFHITLFALAAAPFAVPDTPPDPKLKTILIYIPPKEMRFRPPPAQESPQQVRLAIPTKQPSIEEPPRPQAVPVDKVDTQDAILSYVDTQGQAKDVLSRSSGCIAFGPPPESADEIPVFTAMFCAPNWQPKPLPNIYESSSRYFAIRLDGGFPFVSQLRAENGIARTDQAYSTFDRSRRFMVHNDVARFCGNQGVARPQLVTVRFSVSADSGFDVAECKGTGAAPSGQVSQP